MAVFRGSISNEMILQITGWLIMKWLILLMGFFIFAFVTPVYAGSYEDGLAAYEKGD